MKLWDHLGKMFLLVYGLFTGLICMGRSLRLLYMIPGFSLSLLFVVVMSVLVPENHLFAYSDHLVYTYSVNIEDPIVAVDGTTGAMASVVLVIHSVEKGDLPGQRLAGVVLRQVIDMNEMMDQIHLLQFDLGSLIYSNEEEEVSEKVELYPNFPNPFSGTTTITFQLPEEVQVILAVYNIVGQRVVQLYDDIGNRGHNSVVWDASDAPSGIYIVRLEAPATVLTRKITLVR